ncbi:54S ribosomal protein L6 mitochondrial [Blastocladiella emersonii ATCC 22665]|nr:54S ribosomal protein L6 mitochondrial [Blastocladiella emersonii ATCC 22665]
MSLGSTVFRRSFATARPQLSNIGRKPVVYDPATTSILFRNPYPAPAANAGPPSKHAMDRRAPYTVTVKGPLGTLSRTVPPYVKLLPREDADVAAKQKAALAVGVDFPTVDKQRAAWGSTRAHLANMVHGVTEGWKWTVRFVGIGYRAAVETDAASGQASVLLKLGYCNTISLPVPAGVKAVAVQPDHLELTGACKEDVAQFAADIRKYRRPEPYKQKGVFVNGETIAKRHPKGKKK